jgi:hypothetical protein
MCVDRHNRIVYVTDFLLLYLVYDINTRLKFFNLYLFNDLILAQKWLSLYSAAFLLYLLVIVMVESAQYNR